MKSDKYNIQLEEGHMQLINFNLMCLFSISDLVDDPGLILFDCFINKLCQPTVSLSLYSQVHGTHYMYPYCYCIFLKSKANLCFHFQPTTKYIPLSMKNTCVTSCKIIQMIRPVSNFF